MTPSERQGQWLIRNGVLAPDLVARALRGVEDSSSRDLVALLETHGYLSAPQVEAVRRATASARAMPPRLDTRRDLPAVPPTGAPGSGAAAGSPSAGPPARFLAPIPPEALIDSGEDSKEVPPFLSDPEELVGKRFGNFEVLDTLASGPAGAVFRARQLTLDREVALKLILDIRSDPREVKRFQREAKTLSKLNHPNIVHVADFGERDGVLYIAMELLSGRSVREIVSASVEERGRVPSAAWSVALITRVAKALVFCHQQGIVHRDVNPRNIVVEEAIDRPVLLDFGLVKRTAAGAGGKIGTMSMSLSKSGDIVGTPCFMSPEQLDAKGSYGEITEAADTWGLGATLFYCLTGEPPYPEDDGVMAHITMLSEDPRRVHELAPDVPDWLARLTDRCLQKAPGDRPRLFELVTGLGERADELPLDDDAEAGWLQPLLFGVPAALLSFALVVFLLLGGGPRLVEAEAASAKVRTPRVMVRGRVDRGPAAVRINDLDVVTEEDGSFAREVSLREGRNAIAVALVEHAGDPKRTRTVEVFCDTEPPRLRLDQPVSGRGVLELDSDRLAGRVEDVSAVRVAVAGVEAPVGDNGRFVLTIKDQREPIHGELVATDALGNVTRRRITLMTPTAVRLQRSVEVLETMSQWLSADTRKQDLAAAEVARRLGDAFKFLGLESYECQDRRFRIAAYRHLRTGLVLHLLPGGSYEMGSDEQEEWQFHLGIERDFREQVRRQFGDGSPELRRAEQFIARTRSHLRVQMSFDFDRHRCTVKPFLIGRAEVTRRAWKQVEGGPVPGPEGPDDRPVSRASWQECQSWLQAAGDGLRFPSEGEWEFACRAGTRTRFFWGDAFDPAYANKLDLNAAPVPVDARTRTNAFGLVNMLGNALEWTSDDFTRDRRAGPTDERPRREPNAPAKALRGGPLNNLLENCRSASRFWYAPSSPMGASGLRVALSIPEEAR